MNYKCDIESQTTVIVIIKYLTSDGNTLEYCFLLHNT